MITKELLEIIEKIDKNLIEYFSDLNQSDREKVLSRNLKLTEEVWELASDVLQKFYKRRVTVFNEQNLKEEFADVVINTLLLAKSMNLDINECLKLKLDKIKNRGGI